MLCSAGDHRPRRLPTATSACFLACCRLSTLTSCSSAGGRAKEPPLATAAATCFSCCLLSTILTRIAPPSPAAPVALAMLSPVDCSMAVTVLVSSCSRGHLASFRPSLLLGTGAAASSSIGSDSDLTIPSQNSLSLS
uniref:Uncharacterized protein n=1 Tax=Arundo donax TaxID=35708 RepID=A0A0A9CX67_ARUDO